MDNLFKEHAQTIRIITAVTTETDPFKKTTSKSYFNPLPIKAIVTDLGFAQIQWKLPGITTSKAKEIIIKKKHKNLLEQSYKIEIDNEDYLGWKINGKLQYRTEDEYIRAYVYYKKES